jgi:ribosomal protein L17
LLTSPELKEHPELKTDKNNMFASLFYGVKFNTICALIFELDIQKDKKINNLINTEHSLSHQNNLASVIKKMFEVREVNKRLKTEKKQEKINNNYQLVSNLNDALIYACHFGNIKYVKYFLTSPELVFHANVHGINPLINESSIDAFEIVQKNFPQLVFEKNYKTSKPLEAAFLQNHLHVVDYLLTSPDLKEHSDINDASYQIFKYSMRNGNSEIISSLIFDYHIERTQLINTLLNNSVNRKYPDMAHQVEEMFAKKQAKNELDMELISNNSITKTNKNKI